MPIENVRAEITNHKLDQDKPNMGDRLGASEMRLSMMGGAAAGACTLLPSADSLLGRLDQIDVRLRQLEEKQRLLPDSSSSYFTEDLRAARLGGLHLPCCKSLSSALHEVHLKGTLVDRLHTLESRVHQLSYELDKGCGLVSASTLKNESAWLQPIMPPPEKNQQDAGCLCSNNRMVIGGPRRSGELFQRGARELQDQKYSKTKAKNPREAMDAAEKRASAICRDEKRRMERTRIYRKWFPVGC